MSYQDLIDFLTRMCIHVDEELRSTAYQSLQNLVTECPEWREDIIHNFIRFFTNSIQVSRVYNLYNLIPIFF